jgi:pheromone shutdown protein TraB
LKAQPNTITELESICAKYFSGSYKDAPYSSVDPTVTETILNEIARASSEYRDQFMVKKIARTVCEQKRVFAVVGGSHVVMQEPAIRKLLSEKCPY